MSYMVEKVSLGERLSNQKEFEEFGEAEIHARNAVLSNGWCAAKIYEWEQEQGFWTLVHQFRRVWL